MEKKLLYDTHIHTVETSPCAHIPAVETVDYYAAHGYDGLIITDHLHQIFLDKVGMDKSWDEIIDLYLVGYRAAKQRGDEIGFDVILGAEMSFPEYICRLDKLRTMTTLTRLFQPEQNSH